MLEDKSLRTQVEEYLGDKILTDADSVRFNEVVDTLFGMFGISANDPMYVADKLRDHGSYTLGVLLTAVEAVLGDSKQAEAFKAIVRREMFAMIDRNQAEHYESLKMQKPGFAPRETRVDGQDELR